MCVWAQGLMSVLNIWRFGCLNMYICDFMVLPNPHCVALISKLLSGIRFFLSIWLNCPRQWDRCFLRIDFAQNLLSFFFFALVTLVAFHLSTRLNQLDACSILIATTQQVFLKRHQVSASESMVNSVDSTLALPSSFRFYQVKLTYRLPMWEYQWQGVRQHRGQKASRFPSLRTHRRPGWVPESWKSEVIFDECDRHLARLPLAVRSPIQVPCGRLPSDLL